MSSVTGKIKEKGQDLKQALTGGGKGKGKGKRDKITNIVEQIDIARTRRSGVTTSGPSSPTFPGS